MSHDARQRAAVFDAALDNLLDELKAEGLPPAAIDRVRAGMEIARAEMRVALRCPPPEVPQS